MQIKVLCLLVVASILAVDAKLPKGLKIVVALNETEFLFPSPKDKHHALRSGQYVQGNSFLNGIAIHTHKHGQTIFVATPRYKEGIPITLGTLVFDKKKSEPKVKPYPDYKSQSCEHHCQGIISVFRPLIDECNRLWIVDSGQVGKKQICPPKIIAFDLETDKRILTYEIPESQYISGKSQFCETIIDIKRGKCGDTMLYAADIASQLLVFDLKHKKSWVVSNKLMYPCPHFGTFSIAGEHYEAMEGILGLALSPKQVKSKDRLLYFHPLSSGSEFAVKLSVLNNCSLWESDDKLNTVPEAFVSLGSRGTQSVSQVMDKNGNLYFGLMDPIAIASWNIRTEYKRENIRIVLQDDDLYQYAADLQIAENCDGEEELWILSDRMQKYDRGTMSSCEINFRVLSINLDKFCKSPAKYLA